MKRPHTLHIQFNDTSASVDFSLFFRAAPHDHPQPIHAERNSKQPSKLHQTHFYRIGLYLKPPAAQSCLRRIYSPTCLPYVSTL